MQINRTIGYLAPSNKVLNERRIAAYQSTAATMCKTCAELSVYKGASTSVLYTEEGLLTFNTSIVYCPTCGKRIPYGRCK